jgi:D-Tyr-tRNAtyr deacylase
MYTTYHLSSAQEVNSDIIDAIKAAFKSRPITITIEEEDQDYEISQEMKSILDERLLEDESDYISAEESIIQLKKK